MSKSRLSLTRSTLTEARDAGIEDLLALHWEEIETDHALNPLAINWGAYRSLERAGTLRIYLLRKAGRLVGYTVWFVQPPLHHSLTQWAVCDLLYLEPAERRGLTGVFLILESIRQMKDAGARIVRIEVKRRREPEDLGYQRGRDTVGALLSRLGFALAEEAWVKTV